MAIVPLSNVFTPTPNAQVPGNAPNALGQNFGLPWANSLGSEYGTAYSKTITALIVKEYLYYHS